MTYVSQTVRFTFLTYLGAAEALLATLEDARKTDKSYRITGLSPENIVVSGLVLEGEIDEISEILSSISGATRHDE